VTEKRTGTGRPDDPGSATPRRGYHHGNLREALIEAGTEILDEDGLEALSLRACAKRAGVSHAAPQHHFGNLEGLRIACHPMLSVITLTEGEAAAQPHAPTLVEPW